MFINDDSAGAFRSIDGWNPWETVNQMKREARQLTSTFDSIVPRVKNPFNFTTARKRQDLFLDCARLISAITYRPKANSSEDLFPEMTYFNGTMLAAELRTRSSLGKMLNPEHVNKVFNLLDSNELSPAWNAELMKIKAILREESVESHIIIAILLASKEESFDEETVLTMSKLPFNYIVQFSSLILEEQ